MAKNRLEQFGVKKPEPPSVTTEKPVGVCCSTCEHWLSADGEQGICRRYPPQIVIELGRPSHYPPTSAAERCGEWKKRESAKSA